MSKQLRIGLIGTGFMGRAHSNAYRKAPNFFDLGMEPVLQAMFEVVRDCPCEDGCPACVGASLADGRREKDGVVELLRVMVSGVEQALFVPSFAALHSRAAFS